MYSYWTTKSRGGLKPEWGSSLVQSHATSQSPVVSILNNTNQNKRLEMLSKDFKPNKDWWGSMVTKD